MTRDEAEAYIQAHPAQFAGWPINAVLGRVRSQSDPDFYDPTLWVDPDAGSKPAPVPRRRASPVPAIPPPPAPVSPARASLFGISGPMWITGIFVALGLAYHKQIKKAVL